MSLADAESRQTNKRRAYTVAAWGAVIFFATFVRSFPQFPSWMRDPQWAFVHDTVLITVAFVVSGLVQYWRRKDGYRPPNT